MELQHTFTVPAPVDQAWSTLLDVEGIAPCFPGAALTGVDGDNFSGTVKVKSQVVELLARPGDSAPVAITAPAAFATVTPVPAWMSE